MDKAKELSRPSNHVQIIKASHVHQRHISISIFTLSCFTSLLAPRSSNDIGVVGDGCDKDGRRVSGTDPGMNGRGE